MGAATERRQHDRAPLGLGQRSQASDRLAEREPRVDRVGALGRLPRFVEYDDRVGRAPRPADGDVVDDPEQPWPDLLRLSTSAQAHPRLEQCLLQNVLSACVGSRQAAGVREQLLVVAPDQGFKRVIIPRAGERDEPVVGLPLQEMA